MCGRHPTAVCIASDTASACLNRILTIVGAGVQAWLQGMNPQAVQFLVVRIRRENVLEDALNTIAIASPDELKKPLRIIFSSGEAGTGAGRLS